MRLILAVPLLLLAACSVDNDAANDQMTLEYNEQRIRDAASGAANATGEVASGVGNVTRSTGQAIRNEVGDIDVEVTRNRTGNSN